MSQAEKARNTDPYLGTGVGYQGPGLPRSEPRDSGLTPHPTPPPRTVYSNRTRSEPSNDEYDLINFLTQLFICARDRRKPRYESWSRNYRLLQNRFQSSSLQTYSPKDSEIYPTLSSLVAWTTDPNTMVDVFPVADPSSEMFQFVSQLANDMSNIIYTTWQIEDFDAQIKLQLWDSFLYGVGINKTFWDNSLSDGYGNGVFRRVDPWAFYVDPDATSMLDAEYFVEVSRISPDEFVRRFPDASGLVGEIGTGESIDERPDLNGANRSIEGSSNLGALPGGGIGKWKYSDGNSRRGSQTPAIVLYEYWIKQNRSKTKTDLPDGPTARPEEVYAGDWRCVCVASNRVVFDEWADDLWSHAQHPYDRYVFDDIGEFYGIALVDHLAHPQAYINRLLGALQQNAELVGNPVLLEPQGAGTTRTRITNSPGQRIPLVGPQAAQNRPEWLTPPEMPNFIMQLVSFWISRIESISGLSAIVRGATPTQRNAEGVIESVQEAAFVRVRASQRNLEKTLESAAVKLADLIVDNYTEPRIMAILGPESERTSIALRARHFQTPTKHRGIPWKYALQIRSGADFPTSRSARINENIQLYTLGAIDDEALLAAYGYPHYQDVIRRKLEKMAVGAFNPPGARQRAGRSS